MKNYFKNKFWKEENERIKAFKGKQTPLNVPISKDEVEKQLESWKIIKHQEKIGELIKYAPDIVKEKLCNTYNKSFVIHIIKFPDHCQE